MHYFPKVAAMASKRALVVTIFGLVLYLAVGSLASDSWTLSEENRLGFDSNNGEAEGRDVVECPGVCPACPGCPACPSPPDCRRRIPPGYKLHDNVGYYQMHHEPVNWFGAKEACEKTGGYLVIINSAEEANIVNRILAKYNYAGLAHIGFFDLKDQTYVTVLGDLLSTTGYVRWAPGQPSNPGTALCGAYSSAGLYDVLCTNLQGFLCEL